MDFFKFQFRKYAAWVVVGLVVFAIAGVADVVNDRMTRLDKPIIEQHGPFLIKQTHSDGRTDITSAISGQARTKTVRLDTAHPMAPQAADSLGLWSLDITRTATVKTLVRNRNLRRSTDAEITAWFNRMKQSAAADFEHTELKGSSKRKYYTLIKPVGDTVFVKDSKLRILIPEGFDLKDAPQGAQSYYRMTQGDCWGTGGLYCATRAPTASPACFGRLPKDFDLHMVGAMAGAKPSPLSVGGAATKQVDLYIANTARPIVLALGTKNATTWAFHLEDGANIAAVLVSGNKHQVLSGLPASVQTRFTHRRMIPDQCGNGLGSHLHTQMDPWARDLIEIFGKKADHVHANRVAHYFEIGGRFNLQKPQSDAFFGEYDQHETIPQLAIDKDTLRYSIPLSAGDDLLSGIRGKDIPSLISNYSTIWMLIGIILLIRPAINLMRRYQGKSTFGPVTPPAPVKIAYLRGVGVTITALTAGMVTDAHPVLMSQTGPMIMFMTVPCAIIASRAVKAVYGVVRDCGLDIGLSCMLTGAIVSTLAACLLMKPSMEISFLLSPFYGALGGLEFWRARRFPKATAKSGKAATALSVLGGDSVSEIMDTSRVIKGAKTENVKIPRSRRHRALASPSARNNNGLGRRRGPSPQGVPWE